MSKLVYLGGPIIGNTYDESMSWRNQAVEEFAKDEITGLNPLRGKEFLRKLGKLEDGIMDHVMTSDAAITKRDRWDVKRADIVLFNLLGAKKVTIGTMIEYGWASAYDKLIITIMENQNGPNKNIHEHPMIRDLTAYRVETLESGISVAKSIFKY